MTISGRDAELAAVPAGAGRAAVDVVGAVPGIREVRIRESGPGVPAMAGSLPTADPPDLPGDAARVPPGARQRVAEQVASALAAGPLVFDADSAVLTASAAESVRRVAALLVPEPAVAINVEGHVADTPGAADVAQRLSEQRAVVVADALVAAGVDRDSIDTRGRGATVSPATPAGSRRVEIIVR